jgi:hypothetical protein
MLSVGSHKKDIARDMPLIKKSGFKQQESRYLRRFCAQGSTLRLRPIDAFCLRAVAGETLALYCVKSGNNVS